MKTFWCAPLLLVFAGCNSSSGGGSESNFVTCTTNHDCSSGLACVAGTCQRPEAGASGGGASNGGATSSSGAAHGSGGLPSIGGAGGSGGSTRDGGSDAALDPGPDASTESGVVDDGGPNLSTACFDVAPAACGAIANWQPTARNSAWSVYRATAIRGADGFVALVGHGPLDSPDSYAFVTLGDAGGCAKSVAPPWTGLRFTGASRAVSRGGTFALVGDCTARYSCGPSALFLNGQEWVDPVGSAVVGLVDLASDGRAFVVSGEYTSGDASVSQQVIERWLSADGQILLEKRFSNVTYYDIAVLDDGTVALAANDTSGSYVQFQSADLVNTDTWRPSGSAGVLALAFHSPWLAVGGGDGSTHPLTGVLNATTHAEVWSRLRSDVTGDAYAVEVDGAGMVNAALWQGPFGFPSLLLLHDTKTTPGTTTSAFDPQYPAGPARRLPYCGIRTQANGAISFSTDFAGTYCEGD